MVIVHVSYAQINEYHDPNAWLKKLSFYVGILEAMTKYGSIKSIHCISYNGRIHKNGVEYHFIKQKKWELWFPFKLHAYLKDLNPDSIVVHGLIYPWQVILLRWKVGNRIKIIAQHHAERPFRDSRKIIQMWADRYIKAYLFCSSDFGLEWLNRKQIKGHHKIKEVMEASSHFVSMKKEQAKSVTQVPDGKIYLWVGRLDDNKDPLTTARAFAHFARLYPNVTLYMIFQSAELLDGLKNIIADTQTFGTIYLVGRVEHDVLQYWYNSADFIISSSHYEGSGIAVCEGLSCGCIPVVTTIPSFRMMTDNGTIGVLFDPGNVDSLIDALKKTLTMNVTAEKEKVLHLFRKKLSFDAISKKIQDVLVDLD